MKLEIVTAYKTGEIAYVARSLIDQLIETRIYGTDLWPTIKDTWIDHIEGKKPLDAFELTARGLKVVYKGFPDNIARMPAHGLSIIFDQPRIEVLVDQDQLSSAQKNEVDNVLLTVSEEYDLVRNPPPTTLVFPKIIYAKEIIVYDTEQMSLS